MGNGVGKEDFTPVTTNPNPIKEHVLSEDFAKDQVLEGDSQHGAPIESISSNGIDVAVNLSSQGDDVDYEPSSVSKERKYIQKEVKDDRSLKGIKRKIYRPKVFSQISKRTNKPKAQRNKTTPKPSTLNQKRSYVKNGSQCGSQLFVDENSISLPFLNNFNAFGVEQVGLENSTVKNELAVEYNSLGSYQQMASLSCFFLVESKRIGANFPIMSKKKRKNRVRVRLEKFLPTFKKGKRSKTFIRKKKKCWKPFNSEANNVIRKQMRTLVKRIRDLKKKRGRKSNKKEIVVYKESGELQLVPYKRSSVDVDVQLDEETLRVWNILKEENGHEEQDEMKRAHWEEVRKNCRDMINSFIYHMHRIQGDRRFSAWKGSVLDSVVGAFLTQNVSDHLSSSAFMTLASTFPIKTTSNEKSNEEDTQESTPNNVEFSDPKFDNKEMGESKVGEMESQKANQYFNLEDMSPMLLKKILGVPKKNVTQEEKERLLEKERYWDKLREMHTKNTRHSDHEDSVDWEAVRCASMHKVAEAIASRGQHNIIAGRIQRFLNKLKEENGCLDLEWLRDAPPKEAKEYLLNIYGLGLKSVECIRLLTLHHKAFPVDVNVARVGTRLGWVPLQELPEGVQIHNLEVFPNSDKIQQYLWPRLCTLDQPTLYEFHYQLITFGKVFCTKKNPNCNACPMWKNCKHYASSLASKRPALPEAKSDQRIVVTPMDPPTVATSFQHLSLVSSSSTPTLVSNEEVSQKCEPIIEMPASPEPERIDEEFDDEDLYKEDNICGDIEDIPTINLTQETHDQSQALVVSQDAGNIPVPKMKNVSRLKTERLVYVLPDDHPLLTKHTPRELDDPFPYLLVVWTPGELEDSCETPKSNLQDEDNSQTVPGTLLIPCRTGMRGRFPLNGTYFQVNEVFADFDSMNHPINVPREWLWPLKKRIVYFGTGTSAIMRGMSMEQIHHCFWKGFVCVRAIDGKGASRPISSILHRSTTAKLGKGNKIASELEDED